ncbi:endolytic transglycosylase MltG [Candidatus Saccharibacteria bacterium]|nr:endolytic transglycosylase MltG [Candidatus Saccharibacteria bacterium]
MTKHLKIAIVVIVGLIVVGIVVALTWYYAALQPASSSDTVRTFTIIGGEAPNTIADDLQSQGLIRSSTAFRLYLRLKGKRGSLIAGSYDLRPSYKATEIAEMLTSGVVSNTIITFIPGGTVADAKKVLLKAGYAQAEIDAAFSATYDHPVLAYKPASADLEGYIYGETYYFLKGTPVKDIIKRCLDELYQVVQENNLITKFNNQGLNLFQGITMASIVQREGGENLPGVAQVLLLRLKKGIPLGADPTYQYIADKLGVPRDPNLDNPYNTRLYPGLPPGPISTPGKAALLAVAQPANTDYLFFLSGDDNKTYFAHTDAEHQQNIIDHCKEKCQIL